MKKISFTLVIIISLLFNGLIFSTAQSTAPKNIIILIGGGMGYGSLEVTNYYTSGERHTQNFEKWDVRLPASTYHARSIPTPPELPGDVYQFDAEYNPYSAWHDFNNVRNGISTGENHDRFTTTSAAATALATGIKTADRRIGTDINGVNLKTVFEQAKSMGKKAGVVASVPFSYSATASFVVHNADEGNYVQIAQDMIASNADVIIGTGHPSFDNNGQYRTHDYTYVGENTWNTLNAYGWSLIEDNNDFIDIAANSNVPDRMLGVAKVNEALQVKRSGNDKLTNVPSLVIMTKAALNVLKKNNTEGLFLMVNGEGMKVANSQNNIVRMIEEQQDFNNTVDAVITWVAANGGWEENLVIVTSTHETDYITGQNTNMLVPVYAQGAGSNELNKFANRYDFCVGAYMYNYNKLYHEFIDNTDIAKTIFHLWDPPKPIKNAIIMIADGWSINTITATNIHEGKTKQDYQDFPFSAFMSTFHARQGNVSSDNNEPTLYKTSYNSRKAWDYLSFLNYVKNDATDSAAAGTALATGKKTYYGSINVDIEGNNLKSSSEWATEGGRSAGIVTTCNFTDATGATFGGAHNINRGTDDDAGQARYSAIAREMYFDTQLSLILSPGNPEYNDDGVQNSTDYNGYYIGGTDLWNHIKSTDGGKYPYTFTTFASLTVKDIDGDGTVDPWNVITTKSQFVDIANGVNVPKRLLGLANTRSVLQRFDIDKFENHVSLNNVPTLAEMSRAGLNVLNQNPQGFYLMIEASNVDKASHGNNGKAMIREMMDFNRAVEAVVAWVEANSSWEETLLIVTGDHETGYLTGPGENTPSPNNGHPFPISGFVYNSGSHTNRLIPIFAKGVNADRLYKYYASGEDFKRGRYLDNTNLAHLINAGFTIKY